MPKLENCGAMDNLDLWIETGVIGVDTGPHSLEQVLENEGVIMPDTESNAYTVKIYSDLSTCTGQVQSKITEGGCDRPRVWLRKLRNY